jgi:hypothetical protein
MTVLRGPSDADHYRVKVGRYGDRWYTDPLPTCPIADELFIHPDEDPEAADHWQGPSWSIVKGAAGKDWSYVTNKRNGHTPSSELHRIADLEPDMRTQAFNAINKNGLTQAGGRGTIVHLWAEDFLAGRGPRIITDPILFSLKLPKAALDEATEYLEALSAFFDHYQPRVIAAEYVAIHRDLNGYGYGCTPDVIAFVQDQFVGIDWKTRGADSDHGAYPEEAAQIAAGAKAQYMIITDPKTGQPMRDQIPTIDCGLIVSIKPDGCRVYPTNIAKGFAHVEAMHAFWVARLTEKGAIGKPWAPTPTNQETIPWTSTTPKPSKPSKSSKTASANVKPNSTSPTTTGTPSTPSTKPDTTPGTKKATPATASRITNTTSVTSTTSPPPSSSTAPADEFATTSKILADAMLTWSAELRQYLKDWWPADTPTPGQVRRGEHVWTEWQLDAIRDLCDLGDAPFWQPATPQTRAAS